MLRALINLEGPCHTPLLWIAASQKATRIAPMANLSTVGVAQAQKEKLSELGAALARGSASPVLPARQIPRPGLVSYVTATHALWGEERDFGVRVGGGPRERSLGDCAVGIPTGTWRLAPKSCGASSQKLTDRSSTT